MGGLKAINDDADNDDNDDGGNDADEYDDDDNDDHDDDYDNDDKNVINFDGRFPQHKEQVCILPSTVKIADLFIPPSTFLATHVYTPASVRLTPRTSSLPSDSY